jgi:hypothetical protein
VSMCGCGFCNLIKLFCEQYECVQGARKRLLLHCLIFRSVKVMKFRDE